VPTAVFYRKALRLLLPFVSSNDSPPRAPGCHWAHEAASHCIILVYFLEPIIHLDPATSCLNLTLLEYVQWLNAMENSTDVQVLLSVVSRSNIVAK